jgi:hypothetical protein
MLELDPKKRMDTTNLLKAKWFSKKCKSDIEVKFPKESLNEYNFFQNKKRIDKKKDEYVYKNNSIKKIKKLTN